MDLFSFESKNEFYNQILKDILKPLCSGLEDLISLSLIIENEHKNYNLETQLYNVSKYEWTREVNYRDIKILINIYIKDEEQFFQRMGNSLYSFSKFPVFDRLIYYILIEFENIIKNDLDSQGVHVRFEGYKKNLLAQVVTDFLFHEQLPDVDSIIYLSSLKYEKELCGGKFLFLDNEDLQNKYEIVELENPVKFNSNNYRTIRKLLETVKTDGYLLVNSKNRNIIGIIYNIDSSNCLNFNYTIHFLGHMHWILKKNNMIAIEYKDGNYYITDDLNKERYKSDLQKKYRDIPNSQEKIMKIEKVVETVSQQPHGTILIISENAKAEAIRLCELKRGLLIKAFPIADKLGVLCSIASIDGAVMLDENLVCYAFGVLLDGAIVDGDVSRGARYNSTLTYVKANEKQNNILGVVISEDGMINII